VVMLYVDSAPSSVMANLCMLVATSGCLLHKVGLLLSVVKPNMPKIIGMTLFYLGFSLLSAQMIVIAMGRRTLEKQIY